MLSWRRFVLGVAAAALPLQAARANVPAPYDWDAAPPTSSREAFVAWMVKNRGEDANFLGQRYDRYLKLVAGKDLWEAPTTRAYLMTPREEFVTHDNLRARLRGAFPQHRLRRDHHRPAQRLPDDQHAGDQAQRQGARDRHRLGLPERGPVEPDAQRLLDRDHRRRSPSAPARSTIR